jgi:hypothetical protein
MWETTHKQHHKQHQKKVNESSINESINELSVPPQQHTFCRYHPQRGAFEDGNGSSKEVCQDPPQ